jgi:hypothetical protein
MKCWSEKEIHVHHATYERLGKENIVTDLFPLCKRCHNFFHKHYVWHFIQNTLDFLKDKELPKDIKPTRVYYKPVKKVKKTRWRKSLEERRKNRKPRVKKAKAPFISNTYSATKGKEYKFNNFKL